MSEGCDHLAHFLSILGLYVLVIFLYNTLRSPFLIVKALFKGLLVRGKHSELVSKYGSWAVITGSTDGIGKYYARELARKGLNVVLIARTKDKLVRCAEEIEREFGVQARWIQADFSKGAPMYKHIEEELRDIPVGILVNNVGCTYGQLDALGDVSEEGLWNVVNTNVGAVTIMCRMVINKMKDGRGAIVNVSSATSTQPGPYGAVYSASKAYISNLTDSLQYEYSHLNIDFQLLSPFFITTKINSYSESIMSGGLFIPDAETYARQAVFTLGKTDDTCGYFWHAIQRTVVNMTSYRVRSFFAYIIASRLKKHQTFSQEMTR